MALININMKLSNKCGAILDAKQFLKSKVSVITAILAICNLLLVSVHGVAFSDQENSAYRQNRDLNIKTLPPDPYSGGADYYSSGVLNSADALLSDWDGDHWASLDADEDKVGLKWSSTADEIIFQVGH